MESKLYLEADAETRIKYLKMILGMLKAKSKEGTL